MKKKEKEKQKRGVGGVVGLALEWECLPSKIPFL